MSGSAEAGSGEASGIATRQPPPRLDYLDGLRGWAAVSVLIFHSSFELFGHVVPVLGAKRFILNDGPLAVFVFFVLSGFVLSAQFFSTRSIERVRATAAGRYVRLTVPIAASCLISFALLKYGAMFNQKASEIVARPDWLGVFYRFDPSFWSYIKFSFFEVYFPNQHTESYNVFLWPMPVELKGSFLIFSLVALFGSNSPLRIMACAAAIIGYWHEDPLYLGLLYGNLLASLHVLIRDARITNGIGGNLVGLSLVVFVLLYRFDHDGQRTGAFLGACLLLAPMFSPFLRRLLSCPLSLWFGRISFPLYLVHSAVICSFSSFLIVALNDASWSAAAIAELVIPSTIVASLAVAQAFAPIERFAIRGSHQFGAVVVHGLQYLPLRRRTKMERVEAALSFASSAEPKSVGM